MAVPPVIITFPGSSAGEANRYAADLSASIRNSDRYVKAEQKRDRPDTQDVGTVVAVILGTASITEVAKGIASWLARHAGAKIQISTDGSVFASNLDSSDAARIAEAFGHRK